MQLILGSYCALKSCSLHSPDCTSNIQNQLTKEWPFPFVYEPGAESANLYCPSDLYDPEHPLFSQVYDGAEGSFPSARFSTPGWLKVSADNP